jgi:hypothetical protein
MSLYFSLSVCVWGCRLVGSVVATTQVLILPALLRLYCPSLNGTDSEIRSIDYILCYVILFVGIVVAVAGTIANCIDLAVTYM